MLYYNLIRHIFHFRCNNKARLGYFAPRASRARGFLWSGDDVADPDDGLVLRYGEGVKWVAGPSFLSQITPSHQFSDARSFGKVFL